MVVPECLLLHLFCSIVPCIVLFSPLGRTCWATSNPMVCVFLWPLASIYTATAWPYQVVLAFFLRFGLFCALFWLLLLVCVRSTVWNDFLSLRNVAQCSGKDGRQKKEDCFSSYPLLSPSFKQLLTPVPSLAPLRATLKAVLASYKSKPCIWLGRLDTASISAYSVGRDVCCAVNSGNSSSFPCPG